nr:hypothetical protein GCM10020093_035420 [Planobispora longispora]
MGEADGRAVLRDPPQAPAVGVGLQIGVGHVGQQEIVVEGEGAGGAEHGEIFWAHALGRYHRMAGGIRGPDPLVENGMPPPGAVQNGDRVPLE